MTVTVHHGDSRAVLKGLDAASIDACVCDPPYALVSIGKRFGKEGAAPAKEGKTGAYARASAGFMGQQWDTGATAFDPDFWREVFRVLRPGAHVVAFGGTRTYHRLVCAIEDAGFEIRDQIAWLYGSGFPKSHDVSKGIDRAAGATRRVIAEGKPVKRMVPGADQHKDGWEKTNGRTFTPSETEAATDAARAWTGWGTALKPALEPIVLARKPLEGTVAANVQAHGCGALNIDASRVGDFVNTTAPGTDRYNAANHELGYRPSPYGREGEASSGRRYSERGATDFAATPGPRGGAPEGRWPANVITDGSEEVLSAFPEAAGAQAAVTGREPSTTTRNTFGLYNERATAEPRGDSGSAARFFYSAKADAEDRLGSKHPTVKPVDLMAYLCRLVTPPGGLVLDPFAGTGTTGLAALGQGFDAILIEREEKYVEDIHRRLAWARGEGRLTAQEIARTTGASPIGGLFAGIEDPPRERERERDAGSSTATSRGTSDRADGAEMVIAQ